jgi:nitrogen fixation/metabolism regulation signal transduction histidine kinase
MKTTQTLLRDYTAELTGNNEKVERNTRESKMTAKHTSEVQKAIEHLISCLPTIVIGLSLDNNIVLWNATAEEVFGCDTDKVMGLHLSQCGLVWEWAKIADTILQSRHNNEPMRVDNVGFRGPDGD